MTKNKADGQPLIYVVCGKDKFLVSRHCESVLDKLLEPDERTMSLLIIEADKAQPVDIFDELRTLPFLAKKRVVVLQDADKFISDNRELLEKYFDNPSSTGILILTVNTWQKSTRLAKKLPSVGSLISVEEIKNYKLADFVINYAQTEHSKKITKSSAQLLVELVGDEPGRLCSEIDKLCSYNQQSKTISNDDIAKLVGNNRFFDAFNVIDAMGAADVEKAVGRLRRMFASDKAAEHTVVGAFAYHFRRMFTAKSMLEKGISTSEVIKKCKIFWNKNEFFDSLKKLTINQLGNLLSELAGIDYGVKTGRVSVEIALERLVVRVSMSNARPN